MDITVKELVDYLASVNPDAKIEVIVANYPRPFGFAFGGDEGCTKETCDTFSFYVDGNDERSETQPAREGDE